MQGARAARKRKKDWIAKRHKAYNLRRREVESKGKGEKGEDRKKERKGQESKKTYILCNVSH